MDYLTLLNQIVAFVPTVGQVILQFYTDPKSFNITQKDNTTPVTAADLAAHALLCQYLAELTPHCPILSEEGQAIAFSERKQWEYYWLVDPLDGTREFIAGNGEFTVNIALIYQHRPVLGVLYHPVSGDCFYAAEGVGAYLKKSGGAVLSLHTRTQAVKSLEVLISRHHAPQGLPALAGLATPYHFYPQGSALKFCRIAAGQADVYPRVGPTAEWDTAAGQCIVEQAGGLVLQASGEVLKYNTKASLQNPSFIVLGDKQANRALWLSWITAP